MVLRVLSLWFLRNFEEPLEQGVIKRLFLVSAALNDCELASSALRLAEKFGYPLQTCDYYSLLQACAVGGDISGVIDTLVCADANKADLYSCASTGYRLQDRVGRLVKHPRALEELYYSLVDRHKKSLSVPEFGVNACIMGFGRKGDLNMAKSTLYE